MSKVDEHENAWACSHAERNIFKNRLSYRLYEKNNRKKRFTHSQLKRRNLGRCISDRNLIDERVKIEQL